MTNTERKVGTNKSLGALLIVVGVLLLVAQLSGSSFGPWIWPFFIVVPGATLLATSFFSKAAASLAVPGSILTTVGFILFGQNLTGHFGSWAYTWGLVLASVGFGLVLQGLLANDKKLRADGRRLALLGLGLFATFAIFFESLIFGGLAGSFIWRYLSPLLLVGGGVFLLRSPKRNHVQSGKTPEPGG